MNLQFKLLVFTLKVTSRFIKLKSHSQVPPSDIIHAREIWEHQHYRAAEAASGIHKMKTKYFTHSRLHLWHVHLIQVIKKKQLEARTDFLKCSSCNFLLTWK